ncbi:YHS domain-containing (seleno)protein [Pontitalea aquivivens]|uniref:YHS domain-containing (seleno)protein n=1 Tax=Pontitalea aquivivens TaxID=3388663 RepID=UPI0039706C4F
MAVRFLAPIAILLVAALPLAADPPPPAHANWALAGHDAVAIARDGAAQAGRADQALKWRGQVWLFTTPENRAAFEADPARFAPRFRGYCVMALAEEELAPGSPGVFVLHQGRLYLMRSAQARARFLADPDGWISRAEAGWAAISAR